MSYSPIPKGSGLGRDANPRRPALIDFGFTMQNGSRAQRREILRTLKGYARSGVPGAADELRRITAGPVFHTWRVTLPNRKPFVVTVPQGATASEVLAQWPGAKLEALQ